MPYTLPITCPRYISGKSVHAVQVRDNRFIMVSLGMKEVTFGVQSRSEGRERPILTYDVITSIYRMYTPRDY